MAFAYLKWRKFLQGLRSLWFTICNQYLFSHAKLFTLRGTGRVSTLYKKVLYRGYTDGTFTQEIPHPGHLGVLGPIIRAEVGDTIKVHFKNLATRPFTVHPHGIFYNKADEGAIYADHVNTNAEQRQDNSVKPNQVRLYTWFVDGDHAPTDEDCVTRMYHSHVISSKDVNTGLIGNKIFLLFFPTRIFAS